MQRLALFSVRRSLRATHSSVAVSAPLCIGHSHCGYASHHGNYQPRPPREAAHRHDNFLSDPTQQSSSSPYLTRPTEQQRQHLHSRHDDDGGDGRGRPNATAGHRSSRNSGNNNTAAAPHRGAGRGPMKDRVPPVPTDLADPRRRLAVLVDGSNPNLIRDGCPSREQLYRSSALFSNVLPAVLQVGVPVLLRVFAHQLPSAWAPLLSGNADIVASSQNAAGVSGGAMSDEQHDSNNGAAFLSGGNRFGAMTDASTTTANAVAGGGGAPGLSLLSLPSTDATKTALPPRIQVEYFRVERFIPIAMQIEADARHLYELRTLNHIEGVCYVCHEVDRAMYVSLMQEQRSGSAALAGLVSPDAAVGSAAFFNQYVFDELGMADELLIDGRSKDGA